MIGFVNIDKPVGVTSFDVVRRVKRVLGTPHVGHLGTLDPLASGVLPVAVGKATRLFDYFLDKDKEYVGEFIVGIETTTEDVTGEILKTSEKRFSKEDLEKIVPKFIGEIDQTPPKFSAKKINGERAYKLARAQKDFELSSKKVKIYGISTELDPRDNLLRLEICCRAGTYIRTLGSDICKALGTVCAMKNLRRTRSGCFKIEDSMSLDEFEKTPKVVPIESVLADVEKVELDDDAFKKLKNGVKVFLDRKSDKEFFVFNNGILFCLAKMANDGSIKVIANLYEGE